MRTFLGLVLLNFAILLLAAEVVTLADPALSAASPVGGADQPWYVHAALFAGIAVTGWISARLLSDGIVGRLVRGRGLTPEPVRR
jgi:hypothetical protein